jgi:hypothetical protein
MRSMFCNIFRVLIDAYVQQTRVMFTVFTNYLSSNSMSLVCHLQRDRRF